MEYKTYKTVDEQVEYLRKNKKIMISPEYKHIFIEIKDTGYNNRKLRILKNIYVVLNT